MNLMNLINGTLSAFRLFQYTQPPIYLNRAATFGVKEQPLGGRFLRLRGPMGRSKGGAHSLWAPSSYPLGSLGEIEAVFAPLDAKAGFRFWEPDDLGKRVRFCEQLRVRLEPVLCVLEIANIHT